MNDCLIMGSGRSGTSMVAGALARGGHFLGEELHEANAGNPKGFFEDRAVNALNEEMLALVTPRRPTRPVLRNVFAHRPIFPQRWVAALPASTPLPALPARLAEQLEELTGRRPLLYKDPRFCYTLPYWRSALPRARFVCVFREPGRTARSIVKECSASEAMKSLRFGGVKQALNVWTCMYEHVLAHRERGGDWLFVHYDQFATGKGADTVEAFVGAPVDRSFAEETLKRSPDDVAVPTRTRELYARLCELAGWRSA